MYSNNPLYFDGMCIICIEVGHGESCNESIQCQDLLQAECVTNTCQCTSSFTFIEGHCVGTIGMYKVYISNIIYNAIFSAKLMEIKQWLYRISLNTQQNQRSIQQ